MNTLWSAASLSLWAALGLCAACAPELDERGCIDPADTEVWSAEHERSSAVRDVDPRARALVVGLDGATGPAVEYLVTATDRAPALASLFARGVHAPCDDGDDPRCARTQGTPAEDPRFRWVTAPGWASVLSGVDGRHHCVRDNPPAALGPFALRSARYPTFLRRSHDLGWGTAAAGVATFLTALQGGQPRPGVLDYECGVRGDLPLLAVDAEASCNLTRRAALVSDAPERDARLLTTLLGWIEDPQLRVIMGVFDRIDAQGHASGYDRNPAYLDAIAETDARVQELLDAIARRVRDHDEAWLVVVTADHGGHRIALWGDHGDVVGSDDVVPFALATYGDALPPVALRAPVLQLDVHPTVMGWLGRASPQAQGQVQGLW